MPTEQVTTTATEGSAGKTAPQENVSTPNGETQSQSAATTQVENSELNPQTQGETRPNPSTYYNKRNFQRLEKTITQMQQRLDQALAQQTASPQQQTQPQGFDLNEYWKNPQEYTKKMLEAEIAKVRGEIPNTIQQYESNRQLEQSRAEAKNIILTSETFKKDPHGLDNITDILMDDKYHLEEMSRVFPVEVARLTMALYEAKNGKTNARPGTATKAQMVSTATGANPSGKTNLADEYQKLMAELQANPLAAHDPAFQTRLNTLKMQRVPQNA